MSASRYPDNGRYARDRSPPYRDRDRRASNFGGGYPPRSNESARPNPESGGFPPRETPRGPKSLGDLPRGPAPGPPSGAPSAPRDERGRSFAGRGEATPLRTAPPLSSGPAPPSHNSHSSWRADRDRDRDFDRRERRPTPPRRSPIRDSRDLRDQRDFGPRDLDVNRARRNSRDGPPSAGSTYSDPPPIGPGSSYRGSGIGRGRGGFAGRGRNFHDDRDRHHDPRDRIPERTYRPRSRTPPRRQDRDVRDDRDFDRRDRDDRRFIPREYDSYIGPAGAAKPGLRNLDTHRGPASSDLRHLPGTPTGPTPHSSHHASPSDRLGAQGDSYSRRSSIAIEPLSAKDGRREPGKDEALLASRAEASRERYAPRPSSPPASIPAFGGSNVWRAPISDIKTSSTSATPSKSVPSSAVSTATPATPLAPVASAASIVPSVSSATPAAPVAPVIPTTPVKVTAVPAAPTPKPNIPPDLSPLPPTGPKAERAPDRYHPEAPNQENKSGHSASSRMEPPSIPPPTSSAPPSDNLGSNGIIKTSVAHQTSIPTKTSTAVPPSSTAPSAPSGPAPRPRAPPIAPQAVLRTNASPSFSRATLPQYGPRDASQNTPAPALGPRSGSGGTASVNTSPKSLPANIPTGPKADRAPMAPRPPVMYPPSDRPGFSASRGPMVGGPKSMQWVRPGLVANRPSIPTKREFPIDDRERSFGNAPKAPRLESNMSAAQLPNVHSAKSVSPSLSRVSTEYERPRERAVSAERPVAPSPIPASLETRRHSDVVMTEASPRMSKPPMSATSSAPEALQDSDDDLDLDEDDFAESEAKYNRERARLEAKRVDLSATHLRAASPLQEIVLLSCLTVEHLPQAQPEPTIPEELDIPMLPDDIHPSPVQPFSVQSPPVQPPPESNTVELPTPRAEESEDIEMEEKDKDGQREERPTAPATLALRLRRGASAEQETLPDLSSLPYLGSGPPTPLSDIGQDRPGLPDSIMASIRDRLRTSIEPELSAREMLQQYHTMYKQWRLFIRQWDDERDLDDTERQPSAEPSLKALTPDIQNSAMTGILDGSLATGRRSHSSRWATNLDLEVAIKESLKTAEEERMGKKEKEPRKAMADPDKEATLPLELTEAEAQRRRFIDTNFQREPGQGIFVFHYEPPEDDFTEEEHRVMVHNYKDQYAKKWGKLAEVLYKEVGTERTYKDCINHYYATKWGREYKGKLKGRRGIKKRGGGVARGRAAIANMDRPEVSGEDGIPLPVTETGRPRRSAAPTFGGPETEFDPNAATPVPGRARRQTDADGTQEKAGRRAKTVKDKVGGRKAKNMPLAAAPTGSPVKVDRRDKGLGVKMEDDLGKRSMGEMPISMPPNIMEDQMMFPGDPLQQVPGLSAGMMDRPNKNQPTARPGPSSYWSVSELQDFDKNVAHFGTDWIAIANHMGTKTHTMIKNQYLRLVEGGRSELEQVAKEADMRRERGDDLGPPPTPTPAPKRRYESTQTAPIRQIAPTPEHTSPPLNPLPLPKVSPPHPTPSSRFSTITQAPTQGKALVPAPGFPALPETSLTSTSAIAPQQSPPAPPQRTQPQHHHQHSMSQHKPQQQQQGPRAGYFSDDLPSRFETRPPSQPSTAQQSHRPLQQHPPSQVRAQELHHSPLYRSHQFQDIESVVRPDHQQDRDSQRRYEDRNRRISQEMPHSRPFVPGGAPPLMPPARSNPGLRSPEHRPLPFSHSRHSSQTQPLSQPPPDVYSQMHGTMHNVQQLPPRSTILTPPVKEEPRNPPPTAVPQAQSQPLLHAQVQQPQRIQASAQNAPPPPVVAKPAAEPRKSNLMSLLNDTDPEEPRRKKPSEQGPPSHSSTPQPSGPVAPPPSTTQGYAPSIRRPLYEDPMTVQGAYSRQSYAQQSALPPAAPNRPIDLADDKSSISRPSLQDSWPARQPYHPGQNHPQPPTPLSSQSGLSQPNFTDRLFGNHRSVFAQHNSARHNPSPPPLAGYTNSPNLHSRTPSISGPTSQLSRHSIPNSTAAQHAQALNASSQILQPNPYAQVDPPGSGVPPPGPMGMRPSPHLTTSHIVQQRDVSSRNEHSQASNANMSYSNPQTPNEHPGHNPLRGLANMNEPYRPRDPRDAPHDMDPRHSDRDTSRELSQRADYLHERLSTPALRSTGPSLHAEIRYQPQDRGGYLSQRSQTPLSRPDHGQPPPLQHPPHSSLGVANHSLYPQRPPPEEPPRHFFGRDPRDRSMTERIREEQAQREEHMRRENERDILTHRELRDREMRDRDAQQQQRYRESMMRGGRDLRVPVPPPPPPPQLTPHSGSAAQQQDPRPLSGAGPMDWTSALRPPGSEREWRR